MTIQFPTIESERLIFNQQLPQDAKALYELLSNKQVTEFYDLVFDKPEQACELIAEDNVKFMQEKNLRWAVRDKTSLEFLGGCGINRYDESNHSAVIGYEFTPSTWGKGIATEAVARIVAFIFSEQCPKHINKIDAYVMLGNEASDVVLKKNGFSYDGLLREHGFWQGDYHDLKIYSLLRRDYLANR